MLEKKNIYLDRTQKHILHYETEDNIQNFDSLNHILVYCIVLQKKSSKFGLNSDYWTKASPYFLNCTWPIKNRNSNNGEMKCALVVTFGPIIAIGIKAMFFCS